MFKEIEDSVVIISFIEDEQLHDAESLREFIREIIDDEHKNILVDLGNVIYISSSVLGVLVTTYRELRERGGKLSLLHIQPSVSHLFKITRLDRILEIYNDRKTALESFRI